MSGHSNQEPLTVPPGWVVLSPKQQEVLVTQLARELSEGHRLFGLALSPFASCIGCDDTLIFIEDETRWAIVHPTWSRRPEPPPYPRCEVFDAEMPRPQMKSHAEHVDTSQDEPD